MRRLAIERRQDVAAAGQQHAVDLAITSAGRSRGAVEDAGPRRRRGDRLLVVVRLAARRDGDDWHVYILAGTAMPMRSNARVSWLRR